MSFIVCNSNKDNNDKNNNAFLVTAMVDKRQYSLFPIKFAAKEYFETKTRQ